jgi:hypothetical protein
MVFRVNRSGGSTSPMPRVFCESESVDLQVLLERNHDLLPGDQIDPEDPCRWLLVKREMPVPDPNTGAERWYLDFLFVDQHARPTFVECKLMRNPQARREIVGQLLEYAANGHHYWTTDELRNYARSTATSAGRTLESGLAALVGAPEASVDEFFSRMETNLREGQVRLVFFLDQAPQELKSIVDFLNPQLKYAEVLLVEARQYEQEGVRVLVPSLFGFTEEARRAKRVKSEDHANGGKRWDRASFLAALEASTSKGVADAGARVHDAAATAGFQVGFGSGTKFGAFRLLLPRLTARAATITLYTEGTLWFHTPSLPRTPAGDRVKRTIAIVSERLGGKVPDDLDTKYPRVGREAWTARIDELLAALPEIVAAAAEESDASA